MIYIYDITLNLNKELIEFFEWEDKDDIIYVRRIPMYKISSLMIKDLITHDIKMSKSFLDSIKDKTLVTNKIYQKGYQYLCLFTDDKTIIGVLFKEKGTLISKLLIDEEEEILDFSSNLHEETINYQIKEKRNNKKGYFTRSEEQIKNNLKKELLSLYKTNKIDKLNYFYYEYFNKISNDKKKVFKELINSIDNNFNDKHISLYEIIKISYLHK